MTPTDPQLQDETLEPPERIWIEIYRKGYPVPAEFYAHEIPHSIEYVRAAVAGPRGDVDLISRADAKAAMCYMCAKPDRYKPAQPIEGSERLFHFQGSDNWNAGQCFAQPLNAIPVALGVCSWCKSPVATVHVGANGRRYCSVGCQMQYEDKSRTLGSDDWETAAASSPTESESPILAFDKWLNRYVADCGKLSQKEYGIAYAAFIAAHPGEGPQSTTLNDLMPPAPPDSTRGEGERVVVSIYNDAIEDAKAAIRGEKVDDPYAAATFINAIARKCNPQRYAIQRRERINAR